MRIRKTPTIKCASWILAASAFAWASGFVWYASTIPTSVTDKTTPTSAVVVLTGGSERIETGLQLLAEGLAEKLFISGADERVKLSDLLTRFERSEDTLAERTTVGYLAINTPGNAEETATWVCNHDIISIRLVTASYHMRRSLRELRSTMPDLVIIPHPVFPERVKQNWWRWPGTASLIATEYSKFLLAVGRQGVLMRNTVHTC